ncbi:YbhB/YbcL family Raf kinase inhibitor-like protein [Paraburkholderia antibiotica]|uniref:YbhB/YbcL family Raf kinase inhibitor-like protein n=1 Tax=Paraburkholderia antibiotica TaxID=2728839 RepID=A0A7X9X5S1_9BURK|nr:YbhB/YbcL family Raf kinase inhibitor-like protein [Paraburkholderia antibiotica]NML31970.1 YbhB/YbcL family Raf kinase inhibitor-like protein [Paraburkholderia antibiotica]
MHARCLVVSLASSWWYRSLAVCAMLALSATQSSVARADGAFTLTSANLRAGGTVPTAQVFDQNDCKGGNHSPQLTWRDAPAGTRGFAITMFDEDAPGRGWWHWAVAGIPATVDSLPENASSSGFLKKLGAVEARNDFDTDGYGGPCPPPGKPHRYIITVYALNAVDLRLAQGRPALMFDHEIGTASIGSARLVVNYGR